jgi:hypothetical protein
MTAIRRVLYVCGLTGAIALLATVSAVGEADAAEMTLSNGQPWAFTAQTQESLENLVGAVEAQNPSLTSSAFIAVFTALASEVSQQCQLDLGISSDALGDYFDAFDSAITEICGAWYGVDGAGHLDEFKGQLLYNLNTESVFIIINITIGVLDNPETYITAGLNPVDLVIKAFKLLKDLIPDVWPINKLKKIVNSVIDMIRQQKKKG